MEGQESLSQSPSVDQTPAAPAPEQSPAPDATPATPTPPATQEPVVSSPSTIAEKLAKRAEARKRGPDGKFQSPQAKEDDEFTPPEVKAKQAKEAAAAEAPKAADDPKTDPAAPATPSWAPNFKYKYAAEGKPKQEGEVHDFLREAIKSPEHEKIVRELYEKAHGLDFVKPQLVREREEHGKLKHVQNTIMLGFQDMNRAFTDATKPGGNIFRLDEIFRRLNIPEEVVLKYGAAKAQYYQLPEEQRAVLDARQAAEQRALDAEKQLATAQSSSYEQAAQTKTLALESSLARPDVAPIAAAFDQRVGKPGAFEEAVREYGDAQWHRSQGKIDLTPDQAIEQVIARYGLTSLMSAQAPATPAAPALAPAAAAQVQPAAAPPAPPHAQPKVIPHVKAGATSPAAGRERSRSLADLRKRAAEL